MVLESIITVSELTKRYRDGTEALKKISLWFPFFRRCRYSGNAPCRGSFRNFGRSYCADRESSGSTDYRYGCFFSGMMFLSTTFLPFDMITSSWMKMTAGINPLTYILEGMRFLLAGSSYIYFISGFLISLLLALISLVFAYNCTRKSLM